MRRYTFLRFAVAAAVLAIIAILSAWSTDARGNPTQDVLAEAFALAEQAKQTTSLRERWALYETAHAYLQKISTTLSGSDIGGRLWDEETVEGARYADVKQALLKTGEAVCEREFTAACVLRLARDAHRVMDPLHPGEILGEIAEAQAKVGDIAGAFATLETASSYSIHAAIPSIMAAMVTAGDLAGAIETARGFPDRGERDRARLAIVRALAWGGDGGNGRRVAVEIEDDGDRALALAALAGAGRTAGAAPEGVALFAKAVSLAQGVGDAKARATLLLEIAGIQLVADDVDRARESLAAALSAAAAMTDIYDRSHVLTRAASGFESAGLVSETEEVVEEFRRSATDIDETRGAVSDVIDDAERRWKAGDAAGAKDRLQRARRVALEIESGSSREHAFSNIIRVRAAIGDVEGALADWALIPKSTYARDLVLEVQARTGDIEGLQNTLEGVERDRQREIVLAYIVIPALAESGRIVLAREFANRIVAMDWYRDRAMVLVAKAEATHGEFDAAITTAHAISDAKYRADAFRAIAAVYLKQGRIADANDTLLTAFRRMFGSKGIRLRDYSRSAADALLDIGKLLAEIETSG